MSSANAKPLSVKPLSGASARSLASKSLSASAPVLPVAPMETFAKPFSASASKSLSASAPVLPVAPMETFSTPFSAPRAATFQSSLMPSGFSLSQPAMVAAVAYAALALIAFFAPSRLLAASEGRDPSAPPSDASLPTGWTGAFIMTLGVLIPAALSVYAINCMVVGKCYVFSWIQPGLVAIWAAIIALTAVSYA
jgi:hypothetical protein